MLIRPLITLVVAVSLFPCPAPAEFLAGAATADITPEKWPVDMVGSFSRRLAEHAWDKLHARAMVLSDGTTTIAIVTVDSCYVPMQVFDEAKRRIHQQCAIPTNRMLMSATHTHSAPASRDRREVKADPDYVERVTRGISEAVVTAHRQLQPAQIGHAVVSLPEHLHNRRWFMKPGGIVPNPFGGTDDQVRMNPPRGKDLLDRPAGPTDPALSIVSVRSMSGRPIALLANYSLHYVGGIPAGGVSADYFGEFARLVEQQLGATGDGDPPVVGLLSNGTSGDVNNINFTNPQPKKKPFEQLRYVAASVADHAVAATKTIEYRSDATIAMAERRITLANRRPTEVQIERARQALAAEDESSLPPRAKHYAKWVIQLSQPPLESELVLQAVRIGTLGITAIPCEVFTEIGLELKETSPLNPTFNTSLAGGHYGYLPTPRQHDLGGYETWMGTNTLEKQASVKIVKELQQLLVETLP
jgi:neutral ceramidase